MGCPWNKVGGFHGIPVCPLNNARFWTNSPQNNGWRKTSRGGWCTGGELDHLVMASDSPGDLVLLGIDFGDKAGFVIVIDGPSV